MQKNYTVNPHQFIGRREDTEALYIAENKACEYIHKAAMELGKLFGWSKTDAWNDKGFWQQSLPQELYSILQHYGSQMSIAASKTYLEQHGYIVKEIEG